MPDRPDLPAPTAPARAKAPDGTRITILLATCNGAAHLHEQLASLNAQSDPRWDLWISDDGSTDDTRAIVNDFRIDQAGARDIRLLDGPRQGPAANFMTLLTHPDLPPGPVALSDQDDVWLPDKLALARAGLAQSGSEAGTLYGAQSIHTDLRLREIGRSKPPPRPPSFHNALTQNIVSGHSTVLDGGALTLVRRAGMPRGIPYHDWWLYQLISGAGGRVIIDPTPVLYYRQHGSNAMGAHRGGLASLRRASQVLGRTYGCWIEANTAALDQVADLLTTQNRQVLKAFRTLPARSGPRRAWALHQLGLHRQTRLATASFVLAAGLGRV